METKHIKRDWLTKEGQIYSQETGKTIAIIPYFDDTNEEMVANAKLMASAPNLMESAQMLLIAIKNQELKVFPRYENTADYIQILEDAVRETIE